MRIYNHLAHKVENFEPIEPNQVGLYTCGPTVYDFVHIGNWRTYVFEDILKRVLQFNEHNVVHVMNFTDIDDKIIKRAKEQNVEFTKLTQKYEEAFREDLGKLNILPADFYTRATEYIAQMIELIERLLKKGAAYKAEDGIYFSVEKFPDYGKLSGLSKGNLKKGARVNDDLYDKEAWSDFALWKFEKPGEPSWEAPFGRGRPGWHIECSAMSIDKLGEHFDIHCGGIDLLFPHHENEIAQAEAATGAKFVNYWVEGEHLLVDGEKMSKSLNNFYKLSDIVAKGFDPLALRYLFMTAHYRSKLNFTWESLEAVQSALDNIRDLVASSKEDGVGEVNADHFREFSNAVGDDLNMPRAIAALWSLLKSDLAHDSKYATILKFDQILGLELDKVEMVPLPVGAQELIKKRELLRKEGKFEESDKAREDLAGMGLEIEDTPEGTKWKVKK
ncbi:cysteine--tRNA ligase [Candidatus Curtissbacteria bacterium]|nr:cysteine--tRNA ligase [Candidatus Curtissbacteria bacterium]